MKSSEVISKLGIGAVNKEKYHKFYTHSKLYNIRFNRVGEVFTKTFNLKGWEKVKNISRHLIFFNISDKLKYGIEVSKELIITFPFIQNVFKK